VFSSPSGKGNDKVKEYDTGTACTGNGGTRDVCRTDGKSRRKDTTMKTQT
jgi:hypothetical protein